MTTQRDPNRDLGSYFHQRSVSRAPDGLLEAALAGMESTRQRPRMLVADRWRPRRMVSRASLGPRVAAVVTIVLLLIALATVLAVIGSSRRPAPPFGLAKPGLIAFDANGDLFASKPDGSGRVQLTSGPEFDIVATYAPDGTLIAFESQQPDFSFDVFVMPADGGARVRVIEGLAETSPIAWSPDSHHVAVAARLVGGDEPEIFIGAIDDTGAVRLGGPDVFGFDPTWSPDGRRIAFHRKAPCCGGTLDSLWVVDVDGSNAHEVAPSIADPRVQDMHIPTRTNRTPGGPWPAWSPDGRQLAFLALGGGLLLDVYVVDTDGTNLRNVTNSPEEETGVAWSPDGTRLAYVRTRGEPYHSNAFFLVADADGSNARPVAGPPLSRDLLIWSPDGARLLGMAFADPDDGINADQNTVIELDPSGHFPPVTTRISKFGTASYQRLAP